MVTTSTQMVTVVMYFVLKKKLWFSYTNVLSYIAIVQFDISDFIISIPTVGFLNIIIVIIKLLCHYVIKFLTSRAYMHI